MQGVQVKRVWRKHVVGDAWQSGEVGRDRSIRWEHARYQDACRQVVNNIGKDGQVRTKGRGAVARSVGWCRVAVVPNNQPTKNGFVVVERVARSIAVRSG